jgi:hypothetical protein
MKLNNRYRLAALIVSLGALVSLVNHDDTYVVVLAGTYVGLVIAKYTL